MNFLLARCGVFHIIPRMIRFFLVLAAAVSLFLGGCADSLEVQEAVTADQAGYSPDPTGYVPRQLERNPLGEGAPAF